MSFLLLLVFDQIVVVGAGGWVVGWSERIGLVSTIRIRRWDGYVW